MASDKDRFSSRVLSGLTRLMLRLFFRKIEIVGLELVPKGPCLFVANHMNSLVDPAMLIAFLPRMPSLLGKSTLWEMAILRPFLKAFAAIPVYRRQDPGVDVSRNTEMFARCHELLAEGRSIALFPEGISHNQPALVGLKTGVSRIAIETENRFPGTRVSIVPIGLTFDEKTRFRSRALMVVGRALQLPPAESTAEEEGSIAADREAVEQLTERIHRSLWNVTLNYRSWSEAELIERAVEIYYQPALDLPYELPLSERFEVHRLFIDAYEQLQVEHKEIVEQVVLAVKNYDSILADLEVRDRHVAARYPLPGMVRFCIATLIEGTFLLPFAAVGLVVNIIPYQVTSLITDGRRSLTPDLIATYKLFASLIFYPVTWGIVALAIGFRFGIWAGLGCLLLGPLTGVLALRFRRRREVLWSEARAYFSVRRSGAAAKSARAEVLQQVRALADLYFARSSGSDPADKNDPVVR